MELMSQDFQMLFQNSAILTAGYMLLMGLCGLLALAAMTDYFANRQQEKPQARRNTR